MMLALVPPPLDTKPVNWRFEIMNAPPNRMIEKMRVVLCGATPTVLCLAAFGKLIDWAEFEASMASFTLVPELFRGMAIVLVPTLEVVAFAFWLTKARLTANIVSLALLITFTGVLALHWINNVQPTCACLGLWSTYIELEQTASTLFIRNAILGGISLAAIVTLIVERTRTQAATQLSNEAQTNQLQPADVRVHAH